MKPAGRTDSFSGNRIAQLVRRHSLHRSDRGLDEQAVDSQATKQDARGAVHRQDYEFKGSAGADLPRGSRPGGGSGGQFTGRAGLERSKHNLCVDSCRALRATRWKKVGRRLPNHQRSDPAYDVSTSV